tara:strand:+ start:490 stop:642 length:153 start_codon:yes stop_codon:yes gene_type:complete
MNAVEFLFALFAVFGSTGLWFLWTSFVYKIDQISDTANVEHESKEETIAR